MISKTKLRAARSKSECFLPRCPAAPFPHPPIEPPRPPVPGEPPGALRVQHEPAAPVPAGCHLLPPSGHPTSTELPLSKCCSIKDQKGKVSQSVPNAPATSQEPPALPEQPEEEGGEVGRISRLAWLLEEPGRGGLAPSR